MTDVFQRLYDSEINFAVSTLWDAGFDVKLGDPMNGFKAETTVHAWSEVAPWLEVVAREHFPESDFTKAAPLPTAERPVWA